jgi:DNA polymerase-3 subunit gamma/tau
VTLALYRRYRPITFDEVVGQEHVTEPLIQALRNGKLHHAYLFSGPRGCGKTTSARILARSLNCEQGPTPTPCGKCDSCLALGPDGAGSLDVIEIDAASHGGVDDARDLRERAFFAPVSARFKVYIIDEAHMVSAAGFNALLKLVEEPPEFVKFVFATTEPEKVLPTIRSRTHHYPFRLIPPGTLRAHLERVCEQEGVAVEPAVFPLVVRASGGSARDAMSLLDQLFAGAGPEGVTYASAVGLLGVTDAALLDEVVDALAVADGAAVFQAVDRVVEAGHDPRRFATDLLERLRDLVIIDAVPDAAAKGILDIPADQLERMTGQALRLGKGTLSRLADIVHEGLVEMRGTTSPRLLLELLCARMLLPAASDSEGAMRQRLERLERRFELGTVATAVPADQPVTAPPATRESAPSSPGTPPPAERKPPARKPAEPERPEQGPAARDDSPPAPSVAVVPPAAAAGQPDAARLRIIWEDIKAAAGRKRQRIKAYLLDAQVAGVEGDTLVLSFPHPFHAKEIQKPDNLALFLSTVNEHLGGSWKVRCEVTGDGPGGGSGGQPAGPGPGPRGGGGGGGNRPSAPPEPEPTGFAPGDEPLDEPDDPGEPVARVNPEEQAISLLTSTLGAQKIKETTADG